jgi:lysophospholipase L1-like esterase
MKKTLHNLILTFVSIFAVLIVIEAGLRIVGYGKLPPEKKEVQFFSYDPLYGWRNKPGAEGKLRMVDSVSEVKINSHGLRSDKDYPFTRNEKFRIAIMGDSFTWGYGVDNRDRFSDVLERDLFTNRVEVINAGVPGYGTDQELLLYENEIRKYKPDIVIVAMDLTDVYSDNYQKISHGNPKPHFERDDKGGVRLAAVPPSIGQDHYENGASHGLYITKLLKDGLTSSYLFTNVYLRYLESSGKVDLELSKRLIKRFEMEVRKDDALFLVFFIPSRGDIKRGKYNYLFQEMINFMKANNISYFTLFENFKKAQMTTNLYFPNDVHFNVAGNRLAAKELYTKLIEMTSHLASKRKRHSLHQNQP